MNNKAPGQTAFEAAKAKDPNSWMTPSWDSLGAARQRQWVDAEAGVIEACAKAECDQCARGFSARYDAKTRYFYHDVADGVEIGCPASNILALKSQSPLADMSQPVQETSDA